MGKCWIYHETEAPKIVDAEEAQSYHDDGWADSPAKFVKTTDFGVDPDDAMGVQALGETIEGVKDMANGALNLGEMKNDELKEYAQKHFGKEIEGKKSELVEQIQAMIDADNSE